jgi:hypothetical protein
MSIFLELIDLFGFARSSNKISIVINISHVFTLMKLFKHPLPNLDIGRFYDSF